VEQSGNKDYEKDDTDDDEPGEKGPPGHHLNCSLLWVIVIVAHMQDQECPINNSLA
jgi:hypothetical protein